MIGNFNGMPIVESRFLTVPYEDWSEVRSPSRARRRQKQGHRQNVKYIQVPDPKVLVVNGTIHGHPETIRKLEREARTRLMREDTDAIKKARIFEW